jgi:hypothetical protein
MEGSSVRIKVLRGRVYGGGGSAGVVNSGETSMANPRFKMVQGFSNGLLHGVLGPLLSTHLRGRARVHGWVGGGSPTPPVSPGRAPVHAAVGMAATNGFPNGSSSPPWCARCVPCRGEPVGPPSIASIVSSQQESASPWPCSGHGGHVLLVATMVTFPSWYGSVKLGGVQT